jgi:hypothetical protein
VSPQVYQLGLLSQIRRVIGKEFTSWCSECSMVESNTVIPIFFNEARHTGVGLRRENEIKGRYRDRAIKLPSLIGVGSAITDDA